MTTASKRATVYFDPTLHRALRLKAAERDLSVSQLVNDAVRLALSEDTEDLAAFDERAAKPGLPFASVVKELNIADDVLHAVKERARPADALSPLISPSRSTRYPAPTQTASSFCEGLPVRAHSFARGIVGSKSGFRG